MDKIRHNLYLGDKHDARLIYILKSPITAILNVAEELATEHHRGVISVKSAMRDKADDAIIKTANIVKDLQNLISQGHTVLVHCKQGRSRSPHVIATYLSIAENKPYEEIYDEIRKIRTCVLAYSMGQEIFNKHGNIKCIYP